jgi:DNA-binding winged helix-turn-helix (wHTH) protein
MEARFGEFVLDRKRRQLFRGGEPVHLTPKAFQLLTLLLDKRPEAVAKDELQQQIWGRVHVAETSLAGLVAELRSALDDTAREPRFIRTVHGFGYAFAATAEAAAGEAATGESEVVFRLIWNRREVSLRPGENILGRVRDAVVWLDSPTVSRRHARIVVSGDRAVLEDLGSHNGTFVGNKRIDAPVPLADRDEIRLGSVLMTFRVFTPGDTESQSRPS